MGNLDQHAEFIDSQGSPVMAAVFLGVEPGHSGQAIGPGSTTLPAPLGERSDGGPMVVHGLKGKSPVTKGLGGLVTSGLVPDSPIMTERS